MSITHFLAWQTETGVFGMGHTLWFIFSNIIGITAIVLIKKRCRTERSQNIAMWTVAGLLLISIVVHRFIFAFIGGARGGGSVGYLIPNTFCAMTSFLFAIAVLAIRNKNNVVFHCLIYMSFIGTLIVNLYPDFIGDDGWGALTVFSLLHHTFSFYLGLLIVVLGKWSPDIRKWYAVWLGLAVYFSFGYILMEIVGLSEAFGIVYGFGVLPETDHVGRAIIGSMHYTIAGLIFLVCQFGIIGLWSLCRLIVKRR